LVLGWFKISGFFYFHRFGKKMKAMGGHGRKRSSVYTANTNQQDELCETETALKNRMLN
jgi:hypothetical protein